VNNGAVYEPVIVDRCEIELCRSGYAGKAIFRVLKDRTIDFTEGNEVSIFVNDVSFFKGYVFTKTRDKEDIITVLCYDQIRYLKNRGTYTFDYKKASDIVRIIAGDFRIECGNIEDSGYVIEMRTEDNKTLLDIIQNAVDITYENTGKLFVLYDNFGKLSFSEAGKLACNYLASRKTAEDFDYSSSIDKNVYNQIRLTLKGRKGIIQEYVKKNDDDISRWGMLQYTGSIDDGENGNEKAKKLLEIYGKKKRSFSIKGAFGDTSIRGGSIIYVNYGEMGDIFIDEKMIVEKVSHVFEQGRHTMNLELKGGMIND